VRLSAESRGGRWILGVADRGVGLAPEEQEEIFKPFRRLSAAGATEGSGIGLAFCRKAVERHGGRIWVESRPGRGSHFRFTLGESSDEQPAEEAGKERP
jgi:signal transduction histidine kinase